MSDLKQKKVYHFAGRPVILDDKSYYNLDTHRHITNIPKKAKPGFRMLPCPRVAGTPEQIEEFLRTNNLDPVTNAVRAALMVTRAVLCAGGSLMPRISHTVDIGNFSHAQLDKLCDFELFGLQTRARVVKLVDGDTFDLGLVCPLSSFASGARALIGPGINAGASIVIVRRCRLWGMDAAEHNTPQGPIANGIFRDYTLGDGDPSEWFIDIICMGSDKYGRTLVRVNPKLEQQLLEYRHPEYGAVYKAYYGGTKAGFSADDGKK